MTGNAVSLVPSPSFFWAQGGARRALRGGKKEGPGIQRSRMRQFFPRFLGIWILVRTFLYIINGKRHKRRG